MKAEERIKRLEQTVVPQKNRVQVILCGPDGKPLPCRHGRPYVTVSKEQVQVQIIGDTPRPEPQDCDCPVDREESDVKA